MIAILEVQGYKDSQFGYQLNQARKIEYTSFEDYLEDFVEKSLPPANIIALADRIVDKDSKVVRQYYLHKIGDKWIDCVHVGKIWNEGDDYYASELL